MRKGIPLTVKLGHVNAELITLFEHMFTTLCDEFVKSVGEARHAISQIIEAEIDAGEGIDHRRCLGGRKHFACGLGTFEDCSHSWRCYVGQI